MNRPPFPQVIDSTMYNDLLACPTKFYREHLEHWKPRELSVHLHAGAAFARGLEVTRQAFWDESLSPLESLARGMHALTLAYGAFEAPPGSPKTLDRMLGALEFYFYKWPLQHETAPPALIGKRRAIEFSFAEPLPVLHPETGSPLIFCGRFDQICNFASELYGEDDKTCSQLGSRWSQQWELRHQFTAYCWGARQAGIQLRGFLVRGLCIYGRGYEGQMAITYRPEWMIEQWYDGLIYNLRQAISLWKSGTYPHAFNDACNTYGGCTFRRACMSPEPENWLSTLCQRRRWDPVTRTETLLPTPVPGRDDDIRSPYDLQDDEL